MGSNIKTDRFIKRKRNISNNIDDKSYDFLHKLNLTSIIRKNLTKNPFSNCKTNFIFSANINK